MTKGQAQKKAILKRFGNALRSYRLKIGLSQEELAHRSGLDRTYVGGVERGERNISLINLSRLAHALEVEPFELLKTLSLTKQHAEEG